MAGFTRLFFILFLVTVLSIVFVQIHKKSLVLKSWSFAANSTHVARSYHNTLLVDLISPDDFRKFKSYSAVSSNLTCQERIIISENRYNISKINRPKNLSLDDWNPAQQIENIFTPTFNCSHFVERIGLPGQSGHWICGLELYDTPPKPQECVVYMISDDTSTNDEFILNQLAVRTDCHILSFNLANETEKRKPPNRKTRRFNNVGIDVTNHGVEKTLRTLMKIHGHAWLDLLFLDIGGREYSVLEEIVKDFYEICPIGQLHVKLQIVPKGAENYKYVESFEAFGRWFESLENKGFRPFHSDGASIGADANIDVNYGFINIRGKHLLLKGRENIKEYKAW